MNDIALSHTSGGRIVLHLRAMNRNLKIAWHGKGIARELGELISHGWFNLTTHRDCSWCKKRLRFAPLAFLFRMNTICAPCKDALCCGFNKPPIQ